MIKIMLHILNNINHIIPYMLTKLYVLMINLGNQLFYAEEKMQLINLLKQSKKKMIITKK